MHLAVVIALFAASALAQNHSKKAERSESTVHAIIHQMNVTDDGVVHIADDGVVRSFAGNGTVLAYHALSPTQLGGIINSTTNPDMKHHLQEVWTGVDGRSVDPSQLSNPPAELVDTLPMFSKSEKRSSGKVQSTRETNTFADVGRRTPCFNIACETAADCRRLTGCELSICILIDKSLDGKCD
ncbi:hypothetical protein F5884DRAFT_748919 [Xylogone sp. PMI_703]|nr:hypothetical protein F5884DRAFT_748919 [Xylogone sp. PMI_703]